MGPLGTITLKKVFCGTDVSIVQEWVPAVIPAEAYYLGWQEQASVTSLVIENPVIRRYSEPTGGFAVGLAREPGLEPDADVASHADALISVYARKPG